jgi:translation initiation factor IF-3
MVKTNQIRKFIEQGHPVKITIWFSGRETTRPEVGINLMEDIEQVVEDIGTCSINRELQGKNMYMSITPGVKK